MIDKIFSQVILFFEFFMFWAFCAYFAPGLALAMLAFVCVFAIIGGILGFIAGLIIG
jgi:hypothetical protein